MCDVLFWRVQCAVRKNLKTVEYTIAEHDNDDIEAQNLTYTLENGGLRIRGYMMTNCGGIHFMNCLGEVVVKQGTLIFDSNENTIIKSGFRCEKGARLTIK